MNITRRDTKLPNTYQRKVLVRITTPPNHTCALAIFVSSLSQEQPVHILKLPGGPATHIPKQQLIGKILHSLGFGFESDPQPQKHKTPSRHPESAGIETRNATFRIFQFEKLFGIKEYPHKGRTGALVYDAIFPRNIAERIAQLENSDTPPKDWEATEDILKAEGFDLSTIPFFSPYPQKA